MIGFYYLNLKCWQIFPICCRHQQQQLKVEECWDEPSEPIKYHQLPLSRDCIHLVDNESIFEYFLYTGLKVGMPVSNIVII